MSAPGSIDALRARIPDAAKDIRVNLQNVLGPGVLTPAQVGMLYDGLAGPAGVHVEQLVFHADDERPDPARTAARWSALAERHPQWPAALRLRLARSYGARVEVLLSSGGLGRLVAPGLHEAELHYLHTHEWARTADDVLWRRTKLGLHLDAAGRATVDDWCRRHWTG